MPINPQPAPAEYMSGLYGLTFAVPAGATYCPLPPDWIGSDHGTIIFLEPPRICDGWGYPSSSRGFAPDSVSRVSLFYSYWMGEDEPPPDPCVEVGAIRFLGAARPICESREGDFIVRRVRARYMADLEAVAVLTLVTRPDRVSQDTGVFATMASSVRTCVATHIPDGGPSFTIGTGPPCPDTALWF